MIQLIIDRLNVFHQESRIRNKNTKIFQFKIILLEVFDEYHRYINHHF
jgi:hypothetical protein